MTPRNKGPRLTSRSTENLHQYSTPQRMPQRNSMAPTGMSVSRRMSEMKRISGRGSLIGAKQVKDTRNLADKKVKDELTRRLLDFLRQRQYPSALTSKDFPPSSKEFVNIFNFLYSYIDHSHPAIIPYNKNEEEIIKVMKTLHYPGMLSKSTFKTIAPHSWPTVLGCLSYLCDVATIFSEKLLPNVDAICFPSRDQNGLATDRVNEDKIILDCLVGCFNEFNEGNDPPFTEQTDDLKNELMDNLGVDIEHLRSQQQQSKELERQLQEISSRESDLKVLGDTKVALLSDIQKLETVSKEMENRCLYYKDQTKAKLDRQLDLKEQIQEMKAGLVQLKGNSLKSNLGSHEVERNSLMVTERKRKIEEVKANIEEIESMNWEREIKVTRARGELEKILRQVNSVVIQQDIQDLAGGRLTLTPENITSSLMENQTFLNEVLRESKGSSRKLDIKSQNLKMQCEEAVRENETKKKLMTEKSQQISKLDEEISILKAESVKEENILDGKLTFVKTELQKLKAQERGGLEGLADRVEIAEGRLKEAKKDRAEKYKEGQEFLQSAISRTWKHFEDCSELRKKKAEKLNNQIQEAASKVKNIAKEIEEEMKIIN